MIMLLPRKKDRMPTRSKYYTKDTTSLANYANLPGIPRCPVSMSFHTLPIKYHHP